MYFVLDVALAAGIQHLDPAPADIGLALVSGDKFDLFLLVQFAVDFIQSHCIEIKCFMRVFFWLLSWIIPGKSVFLLHEKNIEIITNDCATKIYVI